MLSKHTYRPTVPTDVPAIDKVNSNRNLNQTAFSIILTLIEIRFEVEYPESVC